jgi:hypothetical protein
MTVDVTTDHGAGEDAKENSAGDGAANDDSFDVGRAGDGGAVRVLVAVGWGGSGGG